MPGQSACIIGGASVAVKAIGAQRANSCDNNVNIGCSRSLRPYSARAQFAAPDKRKEAGLATGLQSVEAALRRVLRYWRRGVSGRSNPLTGRSGRREASATDSAGIAFIGAAARQIFSNERAALVAVSAQPAAKFS